MGCKNGPGFPGPRLLTKWYTGFSKSRPSRDYSYNTLISQPSCFIPTPSVPSLRGNLAVQVGFVINLGPGFPGPQIFSLCTA